MQIRIRRLRKATRERSFAIAQGCSFDATNGEQGYQPRRTMPGTGVELSAPTPPKTPIPTERGAKCGALDDKNDPELVKIVQIWPTLPEQIKTKITDLIEKHVKETT